MPEPEEVDTADFYEWLQAGIKAGYCTTQFCSTHEGPESVMPDLWDGDGNLVADYDEWCYFATLLIPMTGEAENES